MQVKEIEDYSVGEVAKRAVVHNYSFTGVDHLKIWFLVQDLG